MSDWALRGEWEKVEYFSLTIDKCGPLERTDFHIVPGNDVIDMRGNGSVSSDPVLLHEADELRLGQIARRRGLPLAHRHSTHFKLRGA